MCNSWFAATWQGGLVGDQSNRIFSRRIYMKIEFSSQRREILLFLTTNMERRDVTCKPVITQPMWGDSRQSGILDYTLWIPAMIPASGFQYLAVEAEFWIPIVSRIPDSLSCIPNSKAQDSGFYKQILPDSGFHKQKFPGYGNPNYLIWGEITVILVLSGINKSQYRTLLCRYRWW